MGITVAVGNPPYQDEGGSGNDKIVLGDPILAGASSVCSQTYLYAKFDSEDEAENFISYLKTRFFRLLVSSMKITQDAMAQGYSDTLRVVIP